jgi:hypothetical protein
MVPVTAKRFTKDHLSLRELIWVVRGSSKLSTTEPAVPVYGLHKAVSDESGNNNAQADGWFAVPKRQVIPTVGEWMRLVMGYMS